MKSALLLSLFAMQLLIACHSQPTPSATRSSEPDEQSGFGVVELFTSQGCSSCPPADALLGKEIASYNKIGKKLIALSFHVDYWNRLGWTDPYSQHLFTERQYGYSGALKLKGVYTPQIVINGQHETVGGKQGTIENFLRQSFAEKAAASVTIDAVKPKGKNLVEIAYQYSGGAADLHLAIVQKSIATAVKAGENNGRTLTSYNVVRSWKTIESQNGSQVTEIEMPSDYNDKEFSVVMYVQEKGYGKIVAADIK